MASIEFVDIPGNEARLAPGHVEPLGGHRRIVLAVVVIDMGHHAVTTSEEIFALVATVHEVGGPDEAMALGHGRLTLLEPIVLHHPGDVLLVIRVELFFGLDTHVRHRCHGELVRTWVIENRAVVGVDLL